MAAPSVHTLEGKVVADTLKVDPASGLSRLEAHDRLMCEGANRLPQLPPRSPWQVLAAQFKNILIQILLGAAVLSVLVGSTKDALVILTVVITNALVGFFQEYRAERSLAALKAMLPGLARVRRDGVSQQVSAEELVPGDILLLEAGDRVAADGRLLLSAGLEIDESALTGESVPVTKQADVQVAPDAPLAERINCAYMNTLLTRGRAELLVTATGGNSQMGLLSKELACAEEVATPLQVQLDHLGKRLGVIALLLVGLLSFLQLLRGEEISHIVLYAIALAVAAMPEGLPVVVTVTLALGMHKMARQHAVVKRLASVETLGCTTVICADKTGTLTLNQMTARTFLYAGQLFGVSGEGYSPQGEISTMEPDAAKLNPALMLEAVVACNDSHVSGGKVLGDPMEGALLILAAKGGYEPEAVAVRWPRIAEFPFDAAHKFMATFHEDNGQVRIFVKGAPDVLLSRCARWLNGECEALLTQDTVKRLNDEYHRLAGCGLRGLMVATRTIPAEAFDASEDLQRYVDDLICVGLIGLQDPPRPEAMQAIAECNEAGILVKMITGDHQATAAAIAAELGLHGQAISGAQIDRMDSRELAQAIDAFSVFARVTPSHKVKIVRALQAKGHVVAMTGDGVNDAAALKQADIGVAMGISGTAVAKEAATMVLVDDNFTTIVSAVRQGRTLYDNILKFVRFQLSTTIGAILTVFFAPLAGLPDPFTALQILWVAIIMDGPLAVSLALDAARPSIMQDSPRQRDVAVLPFSRVIRVATFGLIMMLGTLAVLQYGLHTGSEERALTLAFTTFVLFQFFNLFNARSEVGSAFNSRFFNNRMLWCSLGATLLLQVLAVHWMPASRLFGTTGMLGSDWGIAATVASSVLVLEELRKFIAARWRRARQT